MNGIYQLQALRGILKVANNGVDTKFGDTFKLTIGRTELNKSSNTSIGDYMYREFDIIGDVKVLDDILHELGYFRTDYTTLSEPRKCVYEIVNVEYVGNDSKKVSKNLAKKKEQLA